MAVFYVGQRIDLDVRTCAGCGAVRPPEGPFLFGAAARGRWPWRWLCWVFDHRYSRRKPHPKDRGWVITAVDKTARTVTVDRPPYQGAGASWRPRT